MKIKLNLHQRFLVANELGELESTKDNIKSALNLIETLGITREEAEDPDLNLAYNQDTGLFEYNKDFDKIVEVEIEDDMLLSLESKLNVKLH